MTAQTSTVKSYTRVVSTGDGGSAFEDAVLDLTEMPVAEGVPPMFLGALGSASEVIFARLVPFAEPHPAAQPQWVVMLQGVIEVQVSDGTSRRFGPGDLLLATDTSGRGHITLTVGQPPFEALSIPITPAS